MKTLLLTLLLAAHVAAAPNVLVILVDDLGYADLGVYGSTRNQTPNIDALARSGQRMTAAYAAPLCTPTRAALMTGRFPYKTGLGRVLFPSDNAGLNPSEHTIGEYFQSLGYNTGLVGKWHLGHQVQHLPLQHGFNFYFGVPYSNDMSPLPLIRGNDTVRDLQDNEQQFLTGWYTSEAINFMQQSQIYQEAFFLVVAHTNVHTPLYTSYRGEVEAVDASTGQLLATLDQLGIRNNTIVVLMSDNGGTVYASNAPLRGYKGSMLEGGVRVPMIWNWPGHIPAGTNNRIASMMDLLPTLVKAAGGTVTSPVDGHNIMPMLTNAAPSPYAAWRYYGISPLNVTPKLKAVRAGDYKLDRVTGRLYNLRLDPGEKRNVALANPAIVKKLKAYR